MDLSQHYRLFIGGKWLGATGRETSKKIDPSNGNLLGLMPQATAEDIDEAIQAAAQALEGWRKTSPHERGHILKTAADLLRGNLDDIAGRMTDEQGKPLFEARLEFAAAADILEWMSEEGKRAYGRIIPARLPGWRYNVIQEPVGVVAAFSPWNFPAATPMRKIAGSLAAGCTCIIKPAEDAPSPVLDIAKALEAAGLPSGVLNVVCGSSREISKQLIASPSVRKISFTGSTDVGRQIATMATQNMQRLTLELGGHAPVLIFDDVDIAKAAEQAVVSKYRNAGQICTAPTRFYVQEKVYDDFVTAFVQRAADIKVGPGRDTDSKMGPMANMRRVETMERMVADARKRGGKVLCGGSRIGNTGTYFEPTVIADVPQDALCYTEEPFGPLAILAPFATEADAIHQANRLPFGLASYAFTNDASRQVRLSENIEAGMLAINSFVISLPETPFGGVKESGYGLEGGIEGLAAYMITKYVSQAPVT